MLQILLNLDFPLLRQPFCPRETTACLSIAERRCGCLATSARHQRPVPRDNSILSAKTWKATCGLWRIDQIHQHTPSTSCFSSVAGMTEPHFSTAERARQRGNDLYKQGKLREGQSSGEHSLGG